MLYNVTEEDINKVSKGCLVSEKPLIIKKFPSKEKRKFALMFILIKEFQKNKVYSEQEVNEILIPIYNDHALLRRSLVDYRFLTRTKDGREYQVNENNDFVK